MTHERDFPSQNEANALLKSPEAQAAIKNFLSIFNPSDEVTEASPDRSSEVMKYLQNLAEERRARGAGDAALNGMEE